LFQNTDTLPVSCYPTNTVKELKKTEKMRKNHPLASLVIARHWTPGEDAGLPICKFPDASSLAEAM